MFMGIYNDKPRHDSDLHEILNRAHDVGVQKIMITGKWIVHDKTKEMKLIFNKNLSH